MASSDKYCWTHKSMRNILRVYLELMAKKQIKIELNVFSTSRILNYHLIKLI